MSDNVTGFRLLTGEFLIGQVKDETDTLPGFVSVADGMVLEFRPNATGQMTMGMRPFIPICSDGHQLLNVASISSIFNLDENILENYHSVLSRMKTGLIVPEEKKIVLG